MLFKLILLFDVLLNADKPASPASGPPPQLTPPHSPFLEIPASMMEKMLDKTNEIGAIINGSISGIRNNREKYRSELKDSINLHDGEPASRNVNLSTCGVDGAYVVERLLGTDLLFSCALVTEGLFAKPTNETHVLPSSPAAVVTNDYEVFVYPKKHDAKNVILARAIMLQIEIKLAANSP